MRISELLISMAAWLESSENEALLLSEYDNKCLDVVADACSKAATILKRAAEETDKIEPEESTLTSENLDHLNEIVTAFDQSENEDLQKAASVIDELLLTIAAPPNWFLNHKEAEQKNLDLLKDKYQNAKKEFDELNQVKESAKAIDEAPVYKDYRIMEHALSSRNCPDHAGAQMTRVAEGVWQCCLDKKQYDYSQGFTTEKGDKVPASNVANQTNLGLEPPHNIFDNRETRLGVTR